MATGLLYQITNLYTGVSGITDLSPALSAALSSPRIVFTAFEDGNYNLYRVDDPKVLRGELVTAVLQELGTSTLVDEDEDIGGLSGAGVLPPNNRERGEIVSFLDDTEYGLADPNEFAETPYKPSLSLDFISQPYLTAGNDRFGTFVGGGASAFWSDMLGRHNLATMFQINGGLKDIAAIVGYTNKRYRWNWGLVAGQVPQISGGLFGSFEDGGRTFVETRDLIRQISRQATGVVSYPFDRIRRVEFSAGIQNITFEREVKQIRTDLLTGQTTKNNQTFPFGRPLNLMTSSVALVYDNSFFGATSPIMGQRYRIEASPTMGSLNYMGVLVDARKYVMVRHPFTLAGRVTHFGRYGRDADDGVLNPLYMGSASLIRGYDFNSFRCSSQGPCETNELIEQLFGSKFLVASMELRFPLLGVLGLGSGMYGAFPVEFLVFGDAGIAWDSRSDRTKAFFLGGDRDPLFSTGVGFRINLFGFLLAEIDYVKAFQRPVFDQLGNEIGRKGPFWQFSFQPGF